MTAAASVQLLSSARGHIEASDGKVAKAVAIPVDPGHCPAGIAALRGALPHTDPGSVENSPPTNA